MINCEVELILTWSKNCVLAYMTVDAAANPAIVAPSGETVEIKDTKLYVSVAILSKENDAKLSEQMKTGFNYSPSKEQLKLFVRSNIYKF